MYRFAAPALILLATPALADLSAEEVLADHLNLLSFYGFLEMETTGTQMTPDGLVVDGFTGIYQDDQNRVEIATPGMVLTEDGNGAVTISYPEVLDIALVINPEAEDEMRIGWTLTPEGLTHIVTGDLINLRHDLSFDSLALGEVSISPPEAAEDLNFSGEVLFTGFSGLMTYQNAERITRTLDLTLESLTQTFSAELDATTDFQINDLSRQTQGKGQLDSVMTLADLALKGVIEDGDIPRHALDLTIGKVEMDQSADMGGEGQMTSDALLENLALAFDLRMSFDGWEDDPEQVLANVQSATAAIGIGRLDQDMNFDGTNGASDSGEPISMLAKTALNGFHFEMSYQGGDVLRHGASLSLDAWNTDLAMGMAREGNAEISADFAVLDLNYDLRLSPQQWERDLLAALRDGQYVEGEFTSDGFAYDIDFEMPGEAVELATRYGPNVTRLSFDKSGAKFFSTATEIETRIGGTELAPIMLSSVGYSLSESLIDLAVPLAPADNAQPFHARLTLGDLTVDDALWNLIDPGERLSRAPANLAFDLEGTTEITSDLFRPNADVPFGATAAQLKTLALDLAGVSLEGSGDISGTITQDAPVGDGTLDLTLTGLHEVLDILIEIGLLPETEAMGARMMLGLIARPGANDGELVSKIEINRAGEIYANGQRIK